MPDNAFLKNFGLFYEEAQNFISSLSQAPKMGISLPLMRRKA